MKPRIPSVNVEEVEMSTVDEDCEVVGMSTVDEDGKVVDVGAVDEDGDGNISGGSGTVIFAQEEMVRICQP